MPRPSPSRLTILLDRLRTLYRALLRVRMPRIFGVVLRNPRDSLCAVALVLAVTAIVVNGLYLQPGRHPAPIFAVRPQAVRLAAPDPGRSDGGPRSDARVDRTSDRTADRTEARRHDSPRPRPPAPPPHTDPAAEGGNPSWQVSRVQRTLNDAGYGPVKVTGVLDDSTREGIARFERAHNLPVTGQNTTRVRHALGAATGRTLD